MSEGIGNGKMGARRYPRGTRRRRFRCAWLQYRSPRCIVGQFLQPLVGNDSTWLASGIGWPGVLWWNLRCFGEHLGYICLGTRPKKVYI
jgi:hypothetical protein